MGSRREEEYVIRNFVMDDATGIGAFDKIKELSYRYNPDFIEENIVCAVNKENQVLGVAHLEPYLSSDDHFRLEVSLDPKMTKSDDISKDLIKSLIDRAKEYKKSLNLETTTVSSWIEANDNKELGLFMPQGFVIRQSNLVMKYDLSQVIKNVLKPEGIQLVDNKLDTNEKLEQYHIVATSAFCGEVWSQNYVRWLINEPTWRSLSAISGDELVGSIMTWQISDEHSATEDIFVKDGWRHRGIAKYMITETLRYLKKDGNKIATLSVIGDNKPAIALYSELGYEVCDLNVLVSYDV